MSTVSICAVKTAAEIEEIRCLFQEYEKFLDVDLCFQGFEEELATLPGKYAPPEGELLIARVDGRIAGCVGVRPIEPRVCEMKRLYVRPEFRGLGLGRELAERIITESRNMGYRQMKLDTLGFLSAAIHVYQSLGFREIGSYYDNPLQEVMYWQLDLDGSG